MTQRFDVIAESYEKANARFPDARADAKKILELLRLQSDDVVLEIACGTGYLTGKLSAVLTKGELTAQDISPEMIKFAIRKVKSQNVRFIVSDDLAFSGVAHSSFDKAACLGGFHHIEDPVKLFRGIQRVLKPRGIFVVGDFADSSSVQRYFDERVHALTDTGHAGLFLSESHMENLGRFAGFKTVSITRELTPFVFKSLRDVGIFYQLVHDLKQDPSDTCSDVRRYMGIKENGGKFVVEMDYVYAVYRKDIT